MFMTPGLGIGNFMMGDLSRHFIVLPMGTYGTDRRAYAEVCNSFDRTTEERQEIFCFS
jgi:hypothetical protein